MKVIIAIDSFKEASVQKNFQLQLRKGIRKVYADAEIDKIPIADGGEGTVEALVTGTGGKIIEKEVKGPLLNPVKASYGILGDKKTACNRNGHSIRAASCSSRKKKPYENNYIRDRGAYKRCRI